MEITNTKVVRHGKWEVTFDGHHLTILDAVEGVGSIFATVEEFARLREAVAEAVQA